MGVKKTMLITFLVCGLTSCFTSLSRSHAAGVEDFGRQPLFFVQNKGQLHETVRYFEKGPGHATYFAEDGIYLSLFKHKNVSNTSTADMEETASDMQSDVLKLSVINGNINPAITAEEILPTKFNYFVGNDPAKWRSNISSYRIVRYKNIYKNIDLKVYGNDHQLEYDVIVKPGGNPDLVKFNYEGARSLSVNEQGELEIELSHGTITQKAPYLYQKINGQKIEISGSFKLLADNAYAFKIDAFDPTEELVIDPVIEYSGYIGGDGIDQGNAITIDSSGNAYITGYTESSYFPNVSYPRENTTYYYDAFVYKVNSSGTMDYVSVFGGTAIDWVTGATREAGKDIAVDSTGHVHIIGSTQSTDFPTTSGAIQSSLAGNQITANPDAFYTVFNTSGNMVYSSYFGGSNVDQGLTIALDGSGNAYIAGSTRPYHYSISSNFPVVNALQPTYGGDYNESDTIYPSDGFIAKISFDATIPANTNVVYSTYFGGDNTESISSLALDNTGDIYITGITGSEDLPGTSTSPIQSTLAGGLDAFVTKINAAGTAILYSTYLGGIRQDYANAIDVDSSGAAYLTGTINSPGTDYDFPLVHPIQTESAGENVAFVTKINPAGSGIDYSTFLGGSSSDQSRDIAVDSNGSAFVVGSTTSTDFPVYNAINGYDVMQGAGDGFITRLMPSGISFIYSTFFGGDSGSNIYTEPGLDHVLAIDVDDSGNAYLTGMTNSRCFPAPEYGAGPTCSSVSEEYANAFRAKISDSSPIPPEVISASPLDGANDVAVDTFLSATFSKEMNTTSYDGNFLLYTGGQPVAGTTGFSGNHTITFTPLAPLANNTVYAATITTGVQDTEGAFLLGDFSWSFTTVPPAQDLVQPTVIDNDPADYYQAYTMEPVDTVFTITFSEDMDPSTITTSSFSLQIWDASLPEPAPVIGTVSYTAATRTATFTPDTDLPYQSNIIVTVASEVTDLAGNPLYVEPPDSWNPDWGTYTGPYQWEIFTECDPLGPTVLTNSPNFGAIDVPVGTTVSFSFDQDFDPATVDQSTFELWTYPSWESKISGSTSYDVSTKTLSFTPDTPLQNDSSYYGIVVSNNFLTIDGRRLCYNQSVLFTTIAGDVCSPDIDPPGITPPINITVASTGPDGTAVSLGSPVVSDTCDADPLITNDAPALFPLGTTTVTWTAIDASGNSSTAVQKVICTPAMPWVPLLLLDD